MLDYWKQHYKRFLLDIVFFLIFFAVFQLSNTRIDDWLYPLILCIALFVVYTIFDYAKFRQKKMELRNAIDSLDFQEEKFSPYDGISAAYNEVIRSINDFYGQKLEAFKQSNISHKEYVMLWSHQIKTPLTALQLMIQKLDNPLPFREQLFHIQRYVDMMLRFLKLDSMQNDLHISRFSLDETIRKTLRYLRPLFLSSNIAVDLQNIEMHITSDPGIIEFVLEQLLSNAIKYGGKQVSIYVKEDTLVIADKGIGIDSADLPLIWSKGFAGQNASLGQKSSGIGLFLVSEMLKALNHQISVESEKNVGTKFMIRF